MVKKTKRSIQWIQPIKTQKAKYAGIHLIAEFWFGKAVEDKKELKKILIGAVKRAKNSPLEIAIHKFNPKGITGIVLLAESHIAIHSWTVFNYLAIDIFTCGNKANPYRALEYLKKIFKPKKVEIKEIKRGKLS